MTYQLPSLTAEELLAHQEITGKLHQWAPTVHCLVRERVAALEDAYGEFNHPLETRTEHAERVLAQGQHPYPLGECPHDEIDDHAYEHVSVGYGFAEDGEFRIAFSGWYPRWEASGESFERRSTYIHCPGWVVTDADGEQRFRDQTTEMVATVRAEREAQDARITALIQEAVAERRQQQGGSGNGAD